MSDTSLGQMFFDRALSLGDVTAFKHRPTGANVFSDVSYRDAGARADAIAAGLLTIPGGLERRSTVGIIGATSVSWILVDFAALSLDTIVAPIYATLLAPEIGYILQDAQADVVVVEDQALLDKVRGIAGGFTFCDERWPALKVRHYVVINGDGVAASADSETLADLEARGRDWLAATAAERVQRRRTTARAATATYAYTSGTTGPPKGVVQTHDNWLSLLEVSSDLQMFNVGAKKNGALLFLPLAHSFGRLIELAAAFHCCHVIASSPETLAEDLVKSRPALLPAAPRVFEKMYARITAGVAVAGPRRRELFAWALSVGKETIPYRQRRKPLPMRLKLQHEIADRLVFARVRARLGLDRIEVMLSGSAPLAPIVHEFFFAMGLNLYEGYGLTETCPALTANHPGRWKLGTVGPPLRNVSIRIAADGEVLAKGPNVVAGYLNRPDADAEAFDTDGWFHTGDIGELDSEGFLRLTDRKKDLLKTSGGKHVAPQKIEGLLKSKPLILEAVVIGDNRNYCTALLMLDEDGWRAWARGGPLDARDGALLAKLQVSINEVNRDLASFESIKYFRVVDAPFSVDNGLLTASFKVKRKEVSARFASLIDEMYPQQGGVLV